MTSISTKHLESVVLAQEEKKATLATNVKLLRYLIAFFLCCLIAGLGAATYLLLHNNEVSTFQDQYNSATLQISNTIQTGLNNKFIAATLVNDIYAQAFINNSIGALPNVTLPGFNIIMNQICALATLRAISFSPLLSLNNRNQWEAYAAANAALLDGPSSLTNSTKGSWIIADGIYNKTKLGKKVKVGNFAWGSTHPTLFFPVWQIAPIASNAAAVMFDLHAAYGTRQETIDQIVTTLEPSFTDVLQLVQDGVTYNPSTIFYAPIFLNGSASTPLVGIFGGPFSWSTLLNQSLPSYLQTLDIVISTATTVFTIAISQGNAVIVGGKPGDFHDSNFNNYKTNINSFQLDSFVAASSYKITVYPTQAFYNTYVTATPGIACAVVVIVIVITALLIGIQAYLTSQRERELVAEAYGSQLEVMQRTTMLQSKKAYVNFISHEMRTPLNCALLGLNLLTKDIKKQPDDNTDSRLDIIHDVVIGCETAVTILNDLLNFDKLEEGMMKLELKSVPALSFITSAAEMFSVQAREKGVNLLFDINFESGDVLLATLSPDEIPLLSNCSRQWALENEHRGIGTESFVDPDECVDIDTYKMNQVVRNLVSNALKFTPVGRSVVIRVRKVWISDPELPESDHQSSVGGSSKGINTDRNSADAAWFGSSKSVLTSLSSLIPRNKNFMSSKSRDSMASDGIDSDSPMRDVEIGTRRSAKLRPRANSVPENKPADLPGIDGVTLSNAAGANQTDTKRKKNNFSSKSMDSPSPIEALLIQVVDSGVGMRPEDSKRLFKEVVQFNPGELQAGGGSGLGMMITKGIIDLHKGEISVTSPGLGQGSAFTLLLTLCSDKVLPTERRVSVRKSTGGAVALRSSPSYNDIKVVKPLRVLVVDDSPLNRKMILRLLQADDHICEEAVNGAEAFNVIKDKMAAKAEITSRKNIENDGVSQKNDGVDDFNSNISGKVSSSKHSVSSQSSKSSRFKLVDGTMYDVIMLDYHMPVMDGPTACEKIRGLGFTGLIIGITGNAAPADTEHFLNCGANKVFVKPVNVEALNDAFEACYDNNNK